MILRRNYDVHLDVTCIQCSNRYEFPIDYDESDWVYFSDQKVLLSNAKGTEKFLFSFHPTLEHQTYIVDPNDIHTLVREQKRKLYGKPITIPCATYCEHCFHESI